MADPDRDAEQALMAAVAQVLQPLARLAVARGLKFPQVQELLKQAFVDQARASDPQAGPRDISRVATAAGLTRREVTRLSQKHPPARAPRATPATQRFTRWQADRRRAGACGRRRRNTAPRPGSEAPNDT